MFHRRFCASLALACALGTVTLYPFESAYAEPTDPPPPVPETPSGTTPPASPEPAVVHPEPAVVPPPPTQAATVPDIAPTKSPTPPTKPRFDFTHAIGVYSRYLFVTRLMFSPYVDQSTALDRGWSVGAQYIHRSHSFDIVVSLDFSWFGVQNGNWLGRGNDPTVDTKYVEFDRLSMLSADVALIGHHAFTRWLELRGGAGLGIGYVFGNVYTTNNSNLVCNKDNAGDTSKCYPITASGMPIYLNQPDTEQKLQATTDPSKKNTAQDPHRTQEFKPPAMAVLNIMMALHFRLQRHISLQVELGFRDAMFAGGGFYFPW
jgi:hypothetical protein